MLVCNIRKYAVILQYQIYMFLNGKYSASFGGDQSRKQARLKDKLQPLPPKKKSGACWVVTSAP